MRLPRFLSLLLNPRANLSRLRTPSDSTPPEEVRRRRVRLRHVLFSPPLLVGGLVVFALFLGVLFGPVLAPENPYLRGRRVLEYVDGTLTSPPFPPSSQYPMGTDELGRDTLSMLLYGTRNTLVAAAFITMARLALGLILGGWAGWHEGRLGDRLITGAVQVLASLPMLLMAAMLILAMDVRRGLPVFIIALCAIGWGEIAQFVRAEFIRIKEEPYLDSGRAVGLTSLQLAVRHVLPNVLPALVVITLLEMGAVLMILGELGFLGIYISGGMDIQLSETSLVRFFTVPEWGAMMASARLYARARPWMVIYPAAAFFISVTGFNLLGEGLRRLIDRGVFNTAVLLSWRVLVAVALITAASVYVTLTLGPAPAYRQLAQQVSEAELMRHLEFLASPDLEGRTVGSEEAHRAAEYILEELRSDDLTVWMQELPVTMLRPTEPPELALVDEDGQAVTTFTHLRDFGESVERHGGSGQAEAPLTLVLFPPGEASRRLSGETIYSRFRGLDLRGRIAVVVSGNAPPDFDTEALIRGAEGVLLVSTDVAPRNQVLSGDLELPALPVFRITRDTADAILAGTGLDFAAILDRIEALEESDRQWEAEELSPRVRMQLVLGPPETVTLYSPMGLLEGADRYMGEELVIVSCHYDGPGQAPDGTVYWSVNEGASGVAAMLEIARLWHEQGFQPRRSVLFAAWAGGGLRYSGAHGFEERPGLLASYRRSAVLHLDRLGGADEGWLMARHIDGRANLLDLLTSSAGRMDVAVVAVEGAAVRYPYQRTLSGVQGTLLVTWGDPALAYADDTLDSIDLSHLNRAVQVVSLALTTAAHELYY